MSTSLNPSNSDNGPDRGKKFVNRLVNNIIKNVNEEPSNPNSEKTDANRAPDESSLNNWRDKTPEDRRAAASREAAVENARYSRPNIRSLNQSISELQVRQIQQAQRLNALEKIPPSVQVPATNSVSTIEALQIQVAKLQGDSQVKAQTIEALQRQIRQIEQQRQYDRIDDSKRQQARELQTEERLKNHFYAAVRSAVEEIIPRRNRSRIPEPTSQPMNPPMPIQRKPGQVEAIAGGVPRLVMYGLVAIASCLSVVFLFNPSFLYSLIEPTQTSLSILLSIIIVSGGVILLAHSWK